MRRNAEAELVRETDATGSDEQLRSAFEAFRAAVNLGIPDPSRAPGLRLVDPAVAIALIGRAGKITKPGALADLIAQFALGTVQQKQEVLEMLDPLARLAKAIALLPTPEA